MSGLGSELVWGIVGLGATVVTARLLAWRPFRMAKARRRERRFRGGSAVRIPLYLEDVPPGSESGTRYFNGRATLVAARGISPRVDNPTVGDPGRFVRALAAEPVSRWSKGLSEVVIAAPFGGGWLAVLLADSDLAIVRSVAR